jgi:hypothetical protein
MLDQTRDSAPPSYSQMVWQGKWWILIIGAICLGFSIGLAALLTVIRPEREKVSQAHPVLVQAHAGEPAARAGNGAS